MRISDWSSDVCSSDLPRAPGESNGKFFVKYEKLACPVRSANNRGFRLGGNRKVDWGWIVWGLDAAVHEALLFAAVGFLVRSEEHTSELQSLMRISYAVICLKNHIDTY